MKLTAEFFIDDRKLANMGVFIKNSGYLYAGGIWASTRKTKHTKTGIYLGCNLWRNIQLELKENVHSCGAKKKKKKIKLKKNSAEEIQK